MPTYRLVLADDARGMAKRIEFDAGDVGAALAVLSFEKTGRLAELWNNDLRLCSLRRSRDGFWLVNG